MGESLETTLSIGYLTWRLPDGMEIKKHLLSVKANISFDSSQGLLMVGPSNGKPLLDQSSIDVSHRPSREIEESIEHKIETLGHDIWSSDLLNTIFKTWVQAAHPDGQFLPEMERQKEVKATPVVHLAPALILRSLNARDLVRFYDDIKARYEAGAEIPLGVQRLVSVVDDKMDQDWNGRLYFPRSSNTEQREIAQRLESRQGVLVQGPPGTGKSHTIANLLCHLLATGKRVLVTSHTPRALKVLRGKLPQSLTALCVDLLGDDLEAMTSLESAVQGITKSAAHWREEESAKVHFELELNLENLQKEEAKILDEISTFYAREKSNQTRGSYTGTLGEIALRLKSEETSLGWISDEIIVDNPIPRKRLSDYSAI